MERVYVNRYEGAKYVDWKENESNDGHNCAKIFLTCIDGWDLHLSYLNDKCGSDWSEKQIKLDAQNETSNMCGLWFKCRGYRVSTTDKQDGELRSNDQSTGGKLKTCCDNELTLGDNLAAILKKVDIKITGNRTTHLQLLRYLYDRLDKYRSVCHLRHIPGAKPPTTVNQMLHWCAGLQWHPMFNKLNAYIPKWFSEITEDYDLQGKTEFTVAAPYRNAWTMKATISVKYITDLLNTVTLRAPKLLIAILGHGQADGIYACDFFINPDNLLYPTKESACLDLLIDICLRLNHQLHFLFTQCRNDEKSAGWSNCWYGKQIGGSRWQCNALRCHNQLCDQEAGQIGNQIHNQTGDQHPTCGIKSPLQSFLEDGLQGFLPHQFTSPGCMLTCSARDHRGLPCKTPMGFGDLSVMASHAQKGAHLREILEELCGSVRQPLTMLSAYFTCLVRRPPQTLGDMFAFYYNFLEHWGGHYDGDKKTAKQHKQDAFEAAVRDANFGNDYSELDPTTILRTSKHNQGGKEHDEGDLFALLYCYEIATKNAPCGRYLQAISLDSRCTFYEKQARLYLSWIIYSSETFWSLLKRLLDECSRMCGNGGSKCLVKCCTKTCTVNASYESQNSSDVGQKPAPPAGISHADECHSIVKCQNTHPTLYKYGFTFGSPWNLSGEGKDKNQKRTCNDFCEALKKVCSDSSVLAKLVHKLIPEYIWEIRYRFFYTTVALWSASFLYLIYVMVGRLDLLHIKSHLRSPASHRIAAQSLLAASRIGKLAKISYLQP